MGGERREFLQCWTSHGAGVNREPGSFLSPFPSPAWPGSQERRSEWEASTSCGMMALSAEKRGLPTCQRWGTLRPTHTSVREAGRGADTEDTLWGGGCQVV